MKKISLLFAISLYVSFTISDNSLTFSQSTRDAANPSHIYNSSNRTNPSDVANPPRQNPANNSRPDLPNTNIPKNPPSANSANIPITKIDLPEIMAIVNNEQITQKDVSNESLRIFGDNVIKDLVKRTLVELECRRRNITITQAEINDEIFRMAKAFNFSTSEWLEIIEKERGITAEQYMQDIICPILGISKLAGNNNITKEDLQHAYESKYGASVQVRQIVLQSKRDAMRIHAEVSAKPDSFAAVAKNCSVDPASQPYGGLIHPIRKYTTDKIIEDVVFSLQEGQISNIVEWAGTFIIFRCEKHLPQQNVPLEQVSERLKIKILDEKKRKSSEKFFEQLLKNAKIEKVFGDAIKMSQKPGVAAIVNDYPISINTLADICIKRYGKEVLADMINRLIIIQECRKNKITITEQDINNELREMAIKNLPLKKDGQPDIEKWMKLATEESGMTPQVYRTNTVFPMLALKKLSKHNIDISEIDLKKSHESNYGEKIRCLAITFDYNDQRRAIEVWNMAKMNPSENSFRELSEKYSSDPSLRLNGGVIPLIHKHSGEPVLEETAFKLQIGELSQIINVNDSLMILLCVGKEPPANVTLEDAKPALIEDLYYKKQKIAVATCYENLYKNSLIINYLTNVRIENGTPKKIESNQNIGTANQKNIPVYQIK